MSSDIYSVSGQYIVCSIQIGSPSDAWKVNQHEVMVYTGLKLIQGRRGDTYLAAVKKAAWNDTFTAPLGAIVRLIHSSGSRKHTYHDYTQFFLVQEGEFEATLEDKVGHDHISCKTTNLKPINAIDEQKKAAAEAEIRNRGWLPSQYDPVRTLYYIWVMMNPKPSGVISDDVKVLLERLEKLKSEVVE
jgi:hypothetical protein